METDKTVQIKCKGADEIHIDKLVEFQGNLKTLTKENYEKLKKEILELGFSEPISVWNDGEKLNTLNGHQRLNTLKTMKNEGYRIPLIPITQVFADDIQQAKKKVLALTSQYGEITSEGLYEFISEADIEIESLKENYRFPEVDFASFEEEFLDKPVEGGKTDEDQVPEVEHTFVKPGDIWQLGEHRLMCGDSTKDVDKLMDGAKANMWITDPPYGVSYLKGRESRHREIKNDDLPLKEMKIFWEKLAKSAHDVCDNNSSYYFFACQGGDQMMMMMSLGDAGWAVKHELMWLKDRLVLGRCDYHYKHEPIIYGWKRKGRHNWYSDRSQTSVLEFKRPQGSDLHPTMKPVELIEYLICNNSLKQNLILDLCGGSGSTLIACEKTNRKCYMMEIDPHYCGVIITRWQDYTGKKAEKLN